jgi:hypothetical protein
MHSAAVRRLEVGRFTRADPRSKVGKGASSPSHRPVSHGLQSADSGRSRPQR